MFALRHPPSTDKTRFFVYSLRNRHQHPNYPKGRDVAALYTERLVSRTKFALRRGLFGYKIFIARGKFSRPDKERVAAAQGAVVREVDGTM